MIDVEKAKELISKKTKKLEPITIDVTKSEGYVLAEDLKSKVDLPLFNNSAMDGFAIKYKDSVKATDENPVKLKIIKTVKAGDSENISVKKGEAAKIMTGAMVPGGADTVVRKEDCYEEDGYLVLESQFSKNQNIRYKGEQIKKGKIGLKKGTLINPAALGFIIELGYPEIKVVNTPNITLLVTGEELLSINDDLEIGKIRDTNSYSLISAINKDNCNIIETKRVKDNYKAIKKRIESQLNKADITIITGGISVGEYDYIKDILSELGVKNIFWRVSQRPGGPLYFGTKEDKLIFGLPGNPASALVCYYEYIRPAIFKMKGLSNFQITKINAEITEDLNKKAGKTHFIRGILDVKNNKYFVRSAGEQGSHMLHSFAISNCIIIFPADKTILSKESKVEVHLLPQ